MPPCATCPRSQGQAGSLSCPGPGPPLGPMRVRPPWVRSRVSDPALPITTLHFTAPHLTTSRHLLSHYFPSSVITSELLNFPPFTTSPTLDCHFSFHLTTSHYHTLATLITLLPITSHQLSTALISTSHHLSSSNHFSLPLLNQAPSSVQGLGSRPNWMPGLVHLHLSGQTLSLLGRSLAELNAWLSSELSQVAEPNNWFKFTFSTKGCWTELNWTKLWHVYYLTFTPLSTLFCFYILFNSHCTDPLFKDPLIAIFWESKMLNFTWIWLCFFRAKIKIFAVKNPSWILNLFQVFASIYDLKIQTFANNTA